MFYITSTLLKLARFNEAFMAFHGNDRWELKTQTSILPSTKQENLIKIKIHSFSGTFLLELQQEKLHCVGQLISRFLI